MIKNNLRSKEISWLSFNARVLQEAGRRNVPLIERMKFLGIYSNNMDEFFRVRVAILKRLAQLSKNSLYEGNSPKEILKVIQQIVIEQSKVFSETYDDIIRGLEDQDIYLIRESELTEEQGVFVQKYFQKKVRDYLMPIIVTKRRRLPDLADDGIYLVVYLKDNVHNKENYALIEIPSVLDRFVLLPSVEGKKFVILLDDVIRYELKDIFYMLEFDEINAYTFKLTRDAELDLTDDLSESYIKQIAKGLERRKEAPPVRFVHDKKMPEDILSILLKKFNYTREDAVLRGGRYHNFKDFIGFPKLGNQAMTYSSINALPHKDIPENTSMFKLISQKDILLHYPYHSFHHFVDYLREASIDPAVREIKITIYRVASNSAVMKALRNAARNGKKVTAIMELQARFDEKANITHANKLKAAGVKVIFGVPGLKVHAKLCFVSRKERSGLANYSCIGTGNFNEDSASVFADHLLLTKHKGIGKEVEAIFEFFNRNYNIPFFNHLLVSPFYLRNSLDYFIDREITNASNGLPAYIHIKLNNLVDSMIINKLYEAKKAGVEVFLNVRGMFALVSEFDTPKNKIESIGLIDRFLEHSRIYAFCNGGDEKMYISSADLMSRNLDRRIEVACPIYDPDLKNEIRTMLDMQRKDNCSARILNNELDNQIRERKDGEEEYRSQLEFYRWLEKKGAKDNDPKSIHENLQKVEL